MLAVGMLSSCVRPGPGSSSPESSPTPPAQPAATLSPALPPAATLSPSPPSMPTLPPPDTGWQELRPGLERRVIQVSGAQNTPVERLNILRMDAEAYTFRLAYDPLGKSLETWLDETSALAVFNGGYYRQEGKAMIPTGLTVVNGQAMGQSYGDFAGMLAVAGGEVSLRWLRQSPYDPGEALDCALQSFPLLVKPGGELGFPAELEDNLPARRTVIAQDRSGRFLALVAPMGYFTLHTLSAYLVNSDLDLNIALNLDGGPSSGLLLSEPREGEPALLPLPLVVLIVPR